MKKIVPYIIAVITFIIVSLAYFYPVLQGQKIIQSDIVQHKGSAREIQDYRNKTGKEAYWTNTSFSGMPAYSVSAKYPNNYIQKIDNKVLRFLPRPADYLFLYFLSFFVLLSVFKVEWKLAIIGSLAFGLSTYYVVILGVGHNAKAEAIAYFPLVIAGIVSVFKKRYLFGFILTSLAMALEINASHPQMTYYLFFSVLILGVFYLLEVIKNKTYLHFGKSIGILLVAVILGLGVNATSLMATKHYKEVSTRSSKASELTIDANGKIKKATTGLNKDYITQYSYGIMETFNLFIPRFYGGASSEKLGENSNTFKFLERKINRKQAKEYASYVPTYWGKQPGVSGPAYIGAAIVFLFVLGLFLVKGKYKKWIVGTTILALVLSYGKNLGFVTNFFIDYIPLYNIFRAVTSIQVLVEFVFPLLAILGLQQFFNTKITKEEKLEALKKSVYIIGGIALFFTVFGTFLFSFESANDRSLDSALTGFSDAVIADRKAIFFKDSLRSLLLVLAVAGILFAYLKEKLKYVISIVLLGVIFILDLTLVDQRYVNEDKFGSSLQNDKPFTASKIDKEILKDKAHYRVLNLTANPMNEAKTSYFHNSLGGYNAAKPRRYEELFDYQIAKMNEEVLNMLNTKYIIYADKNGNETFQKNEETNGNVWFVNELIPVKTANKEMQTLSKIKTKQSAVVRKIDFDKENLSTLYALDTTSVIKLTKKEINKFTYRSFSKEKQFAVFSETYFADWNAYIDGTKTPITRVDYVLRGLEIPVGTHDIVFKFEPTVVASGNKMVLTSYALLILLPLIWFGVTRRKEKN